MLHGQALTALIAAVVAGVGVKLWDLLLETYRSRRRGDTELEKAEIDDRAKLRRELFDELNVLREQLRTMGDELDRARRAHIELFGEHIELKAENNRVTRELEQLRAKYEIVKRELDDLRDQRLA
jgi:chromosome segregation ATPase